MDAISGQRLKKDDLYHYSVKKVIRKVETKSGSKKDGTGTYYPG